MTDDDEKEPKKASAIPERIEDLQHVADYHSQPDAMLQRLSDLANMGGSAAGMGITVYTAGGIFSGTIEGAQDFYHGIAEQYREGVADDDGETPDWAKDFTRMVFEEPAQWIEDEIAADTAAFEKDGTKTYRWMARQCLHLKDALYIAPGAEPHTIPHTRVRLALVAAWQLGRANPPSD
jgi:hypothetical protein